MMTKFLFNKAIIIMQCNFCQKEIIDRYKNALYCSDKCKSRAFYLKNNKQEKEKSLRNYYENKKPQKPPVGKHCKLCGNEFTNLGNYSYCSSLCGLKVRRARMNENCKKHNSRIYYGSYADAHRLMIELSNYLKTMEG